MRITLIRHAPPLVSGLCYGHYDPPVAMVPDWKLRELQQLWELEERPPIFSSTSFRCLSLAQQIAGESLSPQLVHVDSRLRELHFGEWEGRPWDELPREEVDAWAADWEFAHPPGGESVVDLRHRVMRFLEDSLHRGQDIWVSTHAGPIRLLLAHVNNLPITETMRNNIQHLQLIPLDIVNA